MSSAEPVDVAHALRLRGWEAFTTIDAGRQGSSDLEQIRFAAEHGYVILNNWM